MEVWAQLGRQRVCSVGGREFVVQEEEFVVREAESLGYMHEDLG